jgi:hypothetical protein
MNATTLAAAKFRQQDGVMASWKGVAGPRLTPLVVDDQVVDKRSAVLTAPAAAAFTEIFGRFVLTAALPLLMSVPGNLLVRAWAGMARTAR